MSEKEDDHHPSTPSTDPVTPEPSHLRTSTPSAPQLDHDDEFSDDHQSSDSPSLPRHQLADEEEQPIAPQQEHPSAPQLEEDLGDDAPLLPAKHTDDEAKIV